jgi:DNA-directed RNA polymerase subunit M/transcription elongation factor TFIIS
MTYRAAVKTLLGSLSLDDEEADDLEIGIYNWSLLYANEHKVVKNWKNSKFVNIYLDKAQSLYANISPNSYISNNRLLNRLKDSEFLPHEVAFIKRETLLPERWKDVIDKKMKKDEHVYEERPAAMTNQFKCGRCKKRECVFQELQLRSCDEPMTLFVTCLNCGNRWRIG